MHPAKRILLAILALGLIGCDQTLETGYTPKKINASDSERRAYYAPQYSPESHPSKDSGAPDMFPRH